MPTRRSDIPTNPLAAICHSTTASLPDYPRLPHGAQLTNLSGAPSCMSNRPQAVLQPFTHVTSNHGKEILDRLIEAFNIWMNVPMDEKAAISKVVNMEHNASLMRVPVDDDSQMRRSRPVAHSIYGIPQTINTANYVYFLVYQELSSLKSSRMAEKYLIGMTAAELLSLHRGQGLELLWRDSLQCPTEEEYISMVNKKTGGVLRIGIRLMMACSTMNVVTDYLLLINLLGAVYQIPDDFMNLQSLRICYSSNKCFAEDISEGKFSFPVVHGVRAVTSNRHILSKLHGLS
ncbi:isoprenoid synthase domain-containing protein [Mycena sp. CBHHK59/15]|nr:isoprenoid synthase domain-containing protein [Mycena sp. CBHHK59/15]